MPSFFYAVSYTKKELFLKELYTGALYKLGEFHFLYLYEGWENTLVFRRTL